MKPLYSADTHALLWFLTGASNLSSNARAAFEQARSGAATMYVCHVVVAELFYLLRKKGKERRYNLLVARLEAPNSGYHLEPITLDDLKRLPIFDDIPEMHDRLIAIQAERLGATVVTKDEDIQDSVWVKSLW